MLEELIKLEPSRLDENTQKLFYIIMKVIDERDELQERIDKVIEYIKNTYDDVVTSFTEDKPMTNFKARKELLEILKGENYENN